MPEKEKAELKLLDKDPKFLQVSVRSERGWIRSISLRVKTLPLY